MRSSRLVPLDAWTASFGAWALSAIATLGALFIGEVMGQEPCPLCWYQRIFMFPLAIVLFIALLAGDTRIWLYALPLAIAGGAIALWHSAQYAGLISAPLVPCTEKGPSCSGAGMMILGAIPIPYLSLVAFISISALLEIVRRETLR